MDNERENPKVQKVQADNNSIGMGEFTISGTVTGDIHIGNNPQSLSREERDLRRDLRNLLNNVYNIWIKNVLNKSIHQEVLYELGIELREEAVDSPWARRVDPDLPHEVLEKERPILDIFNESNQRLLILGKPGSGKTTTLLQLTRALSAGLEPEFSEPVPVFLTLSTWIDKKQKLDKWLLTELNDLYGVPPKLGKKWLEDRRIVPLLDGLDEVHEDNRIDCVQEINELLRKYSLNMAVCSRIKDYEKLKTNLKFNRAIYILPLTLEQVYVYLNQAGKKTRRFTYCLANRHRFARNG